MTSALLLATSIERKIARLTVSQRTALGLLIRGVHFESASLVSAGVDVTEDVRGVTRLYVDTWVLPQIAAAAGLNAHERARLRELGEPREVLQTLLRTGKLPRPTRDGEP